MGTPLITHTSKTDCSGDSALQVILMDEGVYLLVQSCYCLSLFYFVGASHCPTFLWCLFVLPLEEMQAK